MPISGAIKKSRGARLTAPVNNEIASARELLREQHHNIIIFVVVITRM